MHKYLIELMRYTEEGTPTNEYTSVFADSPQDLADKYTKYNKMRYTSVDEEGKTIVGNKMYKVTAKQGVYATIENFDTFVEVNGVEYHK